MGLNFGLIRRGLNLSVALVREKALLLRCIVVALAKHGRYHYPSHTSNELSIVVVARLIGSPLLL